jgi:NAD(P)-dependent dehydrogenase (short-subunit alcohol dehydrogenase family)
MATLAHPPQQRELSGKVVLVTASPATSGGAIARALLREAPT